MDWNQRYSSDAENWLSPPRSLLTGNVGLLTSGTAFEAAMGMGNNLSFLLELGYRVVGVERSEVAVKYVHNHFPSVAVILADLSAFWLPSAAFDLICNFYYLEMNLWNQYSKALKPGGILIVETLLDKMLEFKPDILPTRLLRSGTLLDIFPDLEILSHQEGWVTSDHGKQKAIASLVARKSYPTKPLPHAGCKRHVNQPHLTSLFTGRNIIPLSSRRGLGEVRPASFGVVHCMTYPKSFPEGKDL